MPFKAHKSPSTNASRPDFTGLEIEKLGSQAAVSKRVAHAARQGAQYPPNANAGQSIANRTLLDPCDWLVAQVRRTFSDPAFMSFWGSLIPAKLGMTLQSVEQHLQPLNHAKIMSLTVDFGYFPQPRRKNGVLLVEEVAQVSARKWKEMSSAHQEGWVSAAFAEQQKTYGEDLVGAYFHGDEQGGHIHAFILPRDKRRAMCARNVFTRGFLAERQTSHAAAVAHLGLHRGIRGSRATHTRLKEFYAQVNQPTPLIAIAPEELPDKHLWQSIDSYKQLVAQNVNSNIQEKIGIIHDKAIAYDVQTKRLSELESTLVDKEKDLTQLRAEIGQLKGMLNALQAERANLARALADLSEEPDLAVIARQLLGVEGETCEGGIRRFRAPDHDIVVDGNKYVVQGCGTRRREGAVSLIQHVLRCEPGTAIGVLKSMVEARRATTAVAAYSRRVAESTAPVLLWDVVRERYLSADEATWEGMRAGFAQQMGVPLSLLEWCHSTGKIWCTQGGIRVVPTCDRDLRVIGGYTLDSDGKVLGRYGPRERGAFVLGPDSREVTIAASVADAVLATGLHRDQMVMVADPYLAEEWFEHFVRKQKALRLAFASAEDERALRERISGIAARHDLPAYERFLLTHVDLPRHLRAEEIERVWLCGQGSQEHTGLSPAM